MDCLKCNICEYEKGGECLYENNDCFNGCDVCTYCYYEE